MQRGVRGGILRAGRRCVRAPNSCSLAGSFAVADGTALAGPDSASDAGSVTSVLR